MTYQRHISDVVAYNTAMRFEVPQFIEIPEKIFGPLTWRQFVYVSGAGGILLIFFLNFPFLIFLLLGLPIGLLGFALAFYPVNSRPFSFFLESVFHYFRSEKLYLWRKKGTGVYRHTTSRKAAPQPGTRPERLHSLARELELQTLADDTESATQ